MGVHQKGFSHTAACSGAAGGGGQGAGASPVRQRGDRRAVLQQNDGWVAANVEAGGGWRAGSLRNRRDAACVGR